MAFRIPLSAPATSFHSRISLLAIHRPTQRPSRFLTLSSMPRSDLDDIVLWLSMDNTWYVSHASEVVIWPGLRRGWYKFTCIAWPARNSECVNQRALPCEPNTEIQHYCHTHHTTWRLVGQLNMMGRGIEQFNKHVLLCKCPTPASRYNDTPPPSKTSPQWVESDAPEPVQEMFISKSPFPLAQLSRCKGLVLNQHPLFRHC